MSAYPGAHRSDRRLLAIRAASLFSERNFSERNRTAEIHRNECQGFKVPESSTFSPLADAPPRHSSSLTSLPFLILLLLLLLLPVSSPGVLSSFLSSGGRWFRANRVSRRAYVIMDVARSKVRGKVRRSSSVIGGTFRPPASVIFEDSHCPRRSNQPERTRRTYAYTLIKVR